MSSIVNVLNRVGPEEANDSADVRVVQRLMQMAGRGSPVGSRIGMPTPHGKFDAVTGFWIYHLQNAQRSRHPGQVVDGIVSPAHGSAYGPGTHWTVVILNALAKDNSASDYAAFLSSGGTT
jgi:hypothetical protein